MNVVMTLSVVRGCDNITDARRAAVLCTRREHPGCVVADVVATDVEAPGKDMIL